MKKKAKMNRKMLHDIFIVAGLLIVAWLFFGNKSAQDTQNAQDAQEPLSLEGSIALMPVEQIAGANASFDVDVYVNTGDKKLGVFNVYFDFDHSDMTVDVTKGGSGISSGADTSEYLLVANPEMIDEGRYRFAGIAASDHAQGKKVHIATIHAKTMAAFTTGAVTMNVRRSDLADESGQQLGEGVITGATVAAE